MKYETQTGFRLACKIIMGERSRSVSFSGSIPIKGVFSQIAEAKKPWKGRQSVQ